MSSHKLMLCLNSLCIEKGHQFYRYPQEKHLHKHHTAYLVDETTFMPIFRDQELFRQDQVKEVQVQLQDEYVRVCVQTAKSFGVMISRAVDQRKVACKEVLSVFRNDNQTEFTQKLRQAQNGSNIEMLQIANIALINRQIDIKSEVKNILRKRAHTYRTKLLKAVATFIASIEKQADELPNHSESPQEEPVRPIIMAFKTKQRQINKMEEEDAPEQSRYIQPNTDQNIPSNELANSSSYNKESHYEQSSFNREGHYQQSSSFSYQRAQAELNSSEEIYLNSAGQSTTAVRGYPSRKTKLVRKRGRRGRPFKETPNATIQVPVYDSIYKQTDMDCFFPKGPPENIIWAVSEYSKSPHIRSDLYTKITIRTEEDYKLIRDTEKLREATRDLTVCQKDNFTPDPNFKLDLIFRLYSRVNQLQYFHIKDVFLDQNLMDHMKQLLARNVQSMETLMIEECWHLSNDITQIIGTMKQLKRLKLHSGYNRKFHLCLQHIFNIIDIQALSISSALFVDADGSTIEESSSSALSNICKLRKLQHLSLYNCFPIYSDIFDYVHPDVYKSLKHLNLGITDINEESVEKLSKFVNLTELSVDETQIKGKDLIKIFQKNPHNQLKELSLWQLNNSPWTEEKRGYLNGFITKQEMSRLAQLLPKLQYLNIAHCKTLKGFNLLKFANLRYVCVSLDLYSTKEISRFHKKIRVYVENMHEEAALRASQAKAIDVDEQSPQSPQKEDSDYEAHY